MAKYRFIGDETRQTYDRAGRLITVEPGDIADLPTEYSTPQPELWEPVTDPAPPSKTTTAKKGA